MIERRGFITGLISLVAAPAIVRAGSLMPVRSMKQIIKITPIGDGTLIHPRFTGISSFVVYGWDGKSWRKNLPGQRIWPPRLVKVL